MSTVEEAVEEISERALRDREEWLEHCSRFRGNTDYGRADWRRLNPHRRDIGERYSRSER